MCVTIVKLHDHKCARELCIPSDWPAGGGGDRWPSSASNEPPPPGTRHPAQSSNNKCVCDSGDRPQGLGQAGDDRSTRRDARLHNPIYRAILGATRPTTYYSITRALRRQSFAFAFLLWAGTHRRRRVARPSDPTECVRRWRRRRGHNVTI